MAINVVKGWFSKVGKGVPQVHLKSFEGELLYKDDAKTEKVMGNEQYEARQLVPVSKNEDGTIKENSIREDSPENLLEDVMEACAGNLAEAAEAFRVGINRVWRIKDGGLDEYEKAAKKCIEMALPWTKGLTVAQVADKLKKMS